MNHEELVKALRCCAENFGCPIECPRYSPADEGVRACVSRLEKDAADAIESLRAQLPKRGEWKPFDLTWGRSIYNCTVCGESADVPTANGKALYNFCPNCGAKMEVQE